MGRPLSGKPLEQAQRLKRMYARGRSLSYENVVRLTGAPARMSPVTELVYAGAQLVFGFSLMEQKHYLDDDVHDAVTDWVFAQTTSTPDRLMGLFQSYGAALGEGTVDDVFVRDLAASIGGRGRDDVLTALRGAPDTLRKLTFLHTAQVFGDKALVQRLQ